jgi:hypothetical protein
MGPMDSETWLTDEGDRVIRKKAFALPAEMIEERYFVLFEAVCREIRSAAPGAT